MSGLDFEATSNETAVALFGLVFLTAFLLLVFKGKRATTFDKKMVGGFSVFLVALVANNPWVYAVSFFIGGLLIATENFLIHLAGIVWADKKDVGGIAKDYHTSKLSSSEIEERAEMEAAETLAEDPKAVKATNARQAKEVQKKIKNVAERYREVERTVLDLIKEHLDKISDQYSGFVLKEHVRVEGENYITVFDAVIAHPGSDSIKAGVEVKYFERYDIARIKDYFLNHAVAYNAYKVLFVLVFGEEIKNRKEFEILGFKSRLTENNPDIGILIYSLDKEGSLVAMDDNDLSKFFPDKLQASIDLYEQRLHELRRYRGRPKSSSGSDS